MTTPLWTSADLVRAASSVLDGNIAATITGFSIDTRSIQAGEVFVALTDARDGHDFVSQAFKTGAAAALVRNDYIHRDGDGALIRVDDPLRALERIGKAARARLAPGATVIAVTGSAGKTGTKEMLRACLAPFGATHAPEKSFNNHWGVPLTLARMPADTKYAVIEIGMNHADEIRPLTKMARPHIAIITNVLPVHIGNFSNGEVGVANAKAEIFEGLVDGGVAILPRDSAHFEQLKVKAAVHTARIVSFGETPGSDVMATGIEVLENRTAIAAVVGADHIHYDLGAPGRHLALNSLAVVALAAHLDLPWGEALRPLRSATAPAGRGARSTLAVAGGELLLIDESYNANPASMRAALATMNTVRRADFPRRIAVLGDMRELGADAPTLHRDLKDAVIASGADVVFACGEHMRSLFELLPSPVQGHWAAKSTELAPILAAALRAGDVVMIKGSLGTNMAPIVSAVRALDAGGLDAGGRTAKA